MIAPKMTSRERAMSAFHRKGYDRIPIKHEGTPEINQMIKDHFGLKNDKQYGCLERAGVRDCPGR